MNDFFARYNDHRFTYDPKNKPELEFIRLGDIRGWSDTGKAGKRARREFLAALVKETKSPVYTYFVERHSTFNYDSLASPKLEFQRLATVRGWKVTNSSYKHAKSLFEEAFNQEFNSDLDKFFRTFPDFDYNPRNEPKAELRRLTKGWAKEGRAYKKARNGFFKAFVKEFDSYFGNDEDIETWESLCRALGVDSEPVPLSITQCRRRLENIYVNIYDLLHHVRTKTPFDFFDTERELREYTCDNDMRFPKKRAKAGILKFLLRFIDSSRGRRGGVAAKIDS